MKADPEPFARHFVRPDGPPIRSFANIGRDALLVVPFPVGTPAVYAHIASFMRHGDADQVDALWRRTGRVLAGRIKRESRPVWVSTSGLGVSWLHIRRPGLALHPGAFPEGLMGVLHASDAFLTWNSARACILAMTDVPEALMRREMLLLALFTLAACLEFGGSDDDDDDDDDDEEWVDDTGEPAGTGGDGAP